MYISFILFYPIFKSISYFFFAYLTRHKFLIIFSLDKLFKLIFVCLFQYIISVNRWQHTSVLMYLKILNHGEYFSSSDNDCFFVGF